ncbi:hypothetical protein KBE46_01840 [Candidatus Saccharibacteria bacterium]|jgi:hypothetical protein|nr:hypothetical protein [Candidatus Saccharibacteria bacterium]MBP9489273.1 hypothetical protein [Candidatus Saccharibacteria bacterium]MBP9552252.1 hypothetical protein [Candidatus Saccharibacteria bacterium]
MVDKIKKSIILPKKRKTADDLYYKNQAKKLLPFKKMNQRDLVDLESSLGATIFGAIPEGHRREFFNVDNDTWIWHEEWAVGNKQICERTIRYEISETQVIKVEPGPHYTHIKGKELNNFITAVETYHKLVLTKIYKKRI